MNKEYIAYKVQNTKGYVVIVMDKPNYFPTKVAAQKWINRRLAA